MSKPVVLITGALTGIGHATALAFGHEGFRLVVSGRHEDKGQALAAELRKAPGPVETPMLERFVGRNEDAKARFLAAIPARRASTPEEIAATIVFLASDKARYLTGQSIVVDDGLTAQ